MSAYKRFVSYIFNYENGVKKENVGYARIENYNGQCRISIYMKVANKREQKAKVYLFYRKIGKVKGIFIKEILIKDGVGNCKITTESENIGNSSLGFEDIGGIVIYVKANHFFGTEWDDKPIYGFEPEMESKEVLQSTKSEKELLLLERKKRDLEEEEKKQLVEQKKQIVEPIEVIEKVEIAKKIEVIEKTETAEKITAEEKIKIEKKIENTETIENVEKIETQQKIKTLEQEYSSNRENKQEQLLQAAVLESKQINNWNEECREEEKRYFENVLECEQEKKDCFDNYTKIYPFYEANKECIGICPRDLESISPILKQWQDNEFLVYGYGRFRHIILLRKKGEQEEYFIGVPGMYRPKEEELAITYGFSMFVPMKKKEANYGDFGYWCTMVEIK